MNIFSVNTEAADIEVVLGAVTQVLEDWEGGRPQRLDLTAVLGQSSSLSQQITQLRSQANLDGGAIIHSTRPRLGPWIIRFQHAMRRLTWWFTDPIIFQVRMFQTQTVTVLAKLNQNQQQLTHNVTAMSEEVNELRRRLDALESRPGDRAEKAEKDNKSVDVEEQSRDHHPDVERA